MEHYRDSQSNRSTNLPHFGLAVEAHGRALTTNPQAAAWYRQAQYAANGFQATAAVRRAVFIDPTFALALADLRALTHETIAIGGRHQTKWERHHIEVVSTAAIGNVTRASDLLRELLADVGCDPLALHIVVELRLRTGHQSRSEDVRTHFPGSYPISS